MIELFFDKESKTLHVKESDKINFDDKQKYLSEAIKLLKKHKTIKILQNSLEASLEFSENTDAIEEFKRTVTEKITGKGFIIYHAVVYNTPKETAASIIYRGFLPVENYFHQIFSTVEAAETWLQNIKI